MSRNGNADAIQGATSEKAIQHRSANVTDEPLPMRRRLSWLVLWIVLIASAVWVFRFAVRDNVWPRNFGVVEAGKVYRAGRLTPTATATLVREHSIKTIIDLGAYEGDASREKIAADTARALGVTRHVFTLDGDGTGHPMGYVEALRLMSDPANQPVLVHCAAGAQRTSVCVMLYEKIYHAVPLEQGLEAAAEHKHDPAKNPKLWPYVQRWSAAIENAVRSGGVIDAPEFRAYRPAGGAVKP